MTADEHNGTPRALTPAPSYDLTGKVCFMAGGTSGINQRIAERFATAGAKVFVMSRKPEKVEATVALLREAGAESDGQAADVRDYQAIEAAVEACADRWGPLDMVLAGQAGNFPAGAAQMSANAFKSVIDIDLLGTFNVFRAAIHRCRRPGAVFLTISAPQATRPYPYQSHVCAAKAGVNMLVKCLAMEWGPVGVRVNGISPGPIDGTEGMDRLAPNEKMRETYRKQLALRTFGDRDDIADAALWLCSGGADYVTGTILEVEGGTTLGDASSVLTF
ncbi:short chain dehydrogenase [Parvularcula bermudensis HTCC2503]|uniref:Short chain dehydrogenase n=1 Tax=Parvularcula bermudensis (strain ATCC BAA-594 / HTCC2503 / KCTC 12087) TaxID=314260 RepID=E0TC28_PARBH|nr:SDR family oxidoreductase [Parvularcula bermudensis]ADM09821.1 short chain dehydrogenase [Parvularcula bermudensis HTCC2503]